MKLGFISQSGDWREEFDLGMESGGLGKLRRAERHFSRAIDLAPLEPYPHYELGYTLTLLKEYQDALRQYLITDNISPAFLQVQSEIFLCRQAIAKLIDCDALSLIREIQFQLDRKIFEGGEAADLALALVQSAPDCPLSYFYLSIAIGDRDKQAHESALRRCLALNPDETTAIYASARLICLLRNYGRFEEAEVICRNTKKLFKSNVHLNNLCDFFSEHETDNRSANQPPLHQYAGSLHAYSTQLLR